MDSDLAAIEQARTAVKQAHRAQQAFKEQTQEQVDAVVARMAEAGAAEAVRLAKLAHEETGFGRVESKTAKNLFATRTLNERMQGMKTVGIVKREGSVWEILTPMGVVAALIPSTNPTSTAMYKAIIAAKARCGMVMSPHPRAKACTAEALRVVAEAAYAAGAPAGLFACLTNPTLDATNALLEHPDIDVILATGGSAMVREAYAKGKPAYGVGSGNVPVYVDRSADVDKAASDILNGTSFDWGTLCSTERSVVADLPIRTRLVEALQARGAYFLTDEEKGRLRAVVAKGGKLNPDQVGQSPRRIAEMAGFRVPENTRALVAEVTDVGPAEPLSMETLSPILSFYTEDGWEAGCQKCIAVLDFGGIGHTLGLHATSEHVIEQFALRKPAMRIVVNTVAALGSVGYTTDLFPAMTLGPGTVGGSITSDNISPLHLVHTKRLAFETRPLDTLQATPAGRAGRQQAAPRSGSWIDEIEARLLARAGNPPLRPTPARTQKAAPSAAAEEAAREGTSALALPEVTIEKLIQKYRRSPA